MAINRTYKDSVFTFLFRNPGLLRELYGALTGVKLPPDLPIVINTLEGVLYRTFLNDLSFLVGNRLIVLVEHQSTINPNLALRMLLYVAELYRNIIPQKALHSRKPVRIPRPEFIVLYNGTAPFPSKKPLKLSVSFEDVSALGIAVDGLEPLELIVTVYNINAGRNVEVEARCETLRQYSVFIAKAREYGAEKAGCGSLSGDKRQEAIKQAVEWCISHDILKEFLTLHSKEVINMLTEELTLEDIVAIHEEDAREEERELVARNALAKGLSVEIICEITGLAPETIHALAGQ